MESRDKVRIKGISVVRAIRRKGNFVEESQEIFPIPIMI